MRLVEYLPGSPDAVALGTKDSLAGPWFEFLSNHDSKASATVPYLNWASP